MVNASIELYGFEFIEYASSFLDHVWNEMRGHVSGFSREKLFLTGVYQNDRQSPYVKIVTENARDYDTIAQAVIRVCLKLHIHHKMVETVYVNPVSLKRGM